MALFNFQCKACIAFNFKKQTGERQMKKSLEESANCTQFAWHEQCEAWAERGPLLAQALFSLWTGRLDL